MGNSLRDMTPAEQLHVDRYMRQNHNATHSAVSNGWRQLGSCWVCSYSTMSNVPETPPALYLVHWYGQFRQDKAHFVVYGPGQPQEMDRQQ